MKKCIRLKRKTGVWIYTVRAGRTYVVDSVWKCFDFPSEADFIEIKGTGMIEVKDEEKEKEEEVVVEEKKVKKKRGRKKKGDE